MLGWKCLILIDLRGGYFFFEPLIASTAATSRLISANQFSSGVIEHSALFALQAADALSRSSLASASARARSLSARSLLASAFAEGRRMRFSPPPTRGVGFLFTGRVLPMVRTDIAARGGRAHDEGCKVRDSQDPARCPKLHRDGSRTRELVHHPYGPGYIGRAAQGIGRAPRSTGRRARERKTHRDCF